MSTEATLREIMAKGKHNDLRLNGQPIYCVQPVNLENNPQIPKRKNDESRTQQALIKWWKYAHTGLNVTDENLLMAFPLQAARTARNGARMKAEGARKGTPDLFLAVPSKGLHGMFVELKTVKGIISPDQKERAMSLHQQGYAVMICRSLDEAINAITLYLR